MSLVERLGFKTLDNLYSEMGSEEILEWMAYDMIKNPEIRERFDKEISIAHQRTFTLEQEADAMRMMFANLGQPQ